MICTFFGHRDTPMDIQPQLNDLLIDLIEKEGADLFYVGNHGNFDIIVKNTLIELKKLYPHIDYLIVLAYLPVKKSPYEIIDYSKTIYPDGLEKTPRRYAISKRNLWMIDEADTVITYVKYKTGGAAKFKEISQKKGKKVINLAE